MLYELAIHFRFLQLFAHNAHNLVSGITFFEDHEFLGELFSAYEEAYDSLAERMIGLGSNPDLTLVQKQAAEILEKEGQQIDAKAWFGRILVGEHVIGSIVEQCVKEGEYSQGTVNLLAQLADDSEKRIYKVQQRIK